MYQTSENYTMDDAEFLHHMKIIRYMLKQPHVRLVLLHPPYTQSQQRIIDAICRNSTKIIGQIERKPPMEKTAQEVSRLITSHHEPCIRSKELQYVILGQQKIR